MAQALKLWRALIEALALSDIGKDLEQMGRQGTVSKIQMKMVELDALDEAAQQAVQDARRKEAA